MTSAVSVGRIPVGNAEAMGGDKSGAGLAVIVPSPTDADSVVDVRASVAPGTETDGRDLNIRAAEADSAHGRSVCPMRFGENVTGEELPCHERLRVLWGSGSGRYGHLRRWTLRGASPSRRLTSRTCHGGLEAACGEHRRS